MSSATAPQTAGFVRLQSTAEVTSACVPLSVCEFPFLFCPPAKSGKLNCFGGLELAENAGSQWNRGRRKTSIFSRRRSCSCLALESSLDRMASSLNSSSCSRLRERVIRAHHGQCSVPTAAHDHQLQLPHAFVGLCQSGGVFIDASHAAFGVKRR